MGKGYMPLFFDTFDETSDLTDEEFGRLIRAIGSYAMGADGWENIITGNERYAFRFLKGQIDRNTEISKARAKAGSSKREQTETNENKMEQNATKQAKEKEKEKEKQIDYMFERLWNVYPRHIGKQNARRAFGRINPDEQLLQIMIFAVEKQKKSAQWQERDGQFIPHLATWLNGKRWEDEVKAAPVPKAVVAQQYEQRDYSGEQDEAMVRMLQLGASG